MTLDRVQTNRRSRVPSLASVALGVGVVAAAALGQIGWDPECYSNYDRSCGALHANSGRKCTNGSNVQPCGDVILDDALVSDIIGAGNNEDGQGPPIQNPYGTVQVRLHLFECSGPNNTGNCNSLGIHVRTCQGRRATGPPCTGGGGGEE